MSLLSANTTDDPGTIYAHITSFFEYLTGDIYFTANSRDSVKAIDMYAPPTLVQTPNQSPNTK